MKAQIQCEQDSASERWERGGNSDQRNFNKTTELAKLPESFLWDPAVTNMYLCSWEDAHLSQCPKWTKLASQIKIIKRGLVWWPSG